MAQQSTSTSTHQERRAVAGAMLLVFILSLGGAQWLSHYRLGISRKRYQPDLDDQSRFVELTSHSVGTLKLQLPPGWKQVANSQPAQTMGVIREAFFTLDQPPYNQLHVMQLNVGQVQDPQSVLYAAIAQGVSQRDLASLSVIHQWARRRGNRMVRRLLAVSRTDGQLVLHHLMIWTHDGRNYWAFYASRREPSLNIDPARMSNFDKLHTSIALLAADRRFKLATAQDMADRRLGFSDSLRKNNATCDADAPGVVLLYPKALDGFCMIRVGRSVHQDDAARKQALTWQFQTAIHRKPEATELVQHTDLEQTNWWTLHFPAKTDTGIGPQPLSRDLHVIERPESAALVVEVVGQVDAVKAAAALLPDLVSAMGKIPESLAEQKKALEQGLQVVNQAPEHLKTAVIQETGFYTIQIANKKVGYQLEQVIRPTPLIAQSDVQVVFPSHEKGSATIDYHWEIDWDKAQFISNTMEHDLKGNLIERRLSMLPNKVAYQSEMLSFDLKIRDILWPVAQDHWPVHWMKQQGLLERWLLIRTVYANMPPTLNWVKMQPSDQGYRLQCRPVYGLDTNIFTLNASGSFVSLEGFDQDAGPTGALALILQRVSVDDLYNQWPTQKQSIRKWIKDHAQLDD